VKAVDSVCIRNKLMTKLQARGVTSHISSQRSFELDKILPLWPTPVHTNRKLLLRNSLRSLVASYKAVSLATSLLANQFSGKYPRRLEAPPTLYGLAPWGSCLTSPNSS